MNTTFSKKTTSGTLASTAGVGTVAWTDPGNAAASDGSYATAAINNQTTRWLTALNWSFTIPPYATIVGVVVEIEKKADDTLVYDNKVQLWYDGAAIGSDMSSTEEYPTSDTVIRYGKENDLWGCSLSPDIVNAATFGVGISTKTAENRNVSIDDVHITVYYNTLNGNSPGTTANVAGANPDWGTPNNSQVSDGSYATVALNNQTSDPLRATNFGFSIPVDATIFGVTVWVEKKTSGASTVTDTVQLVYGGAAVGNAKASPANWSTSDTLSTYGGYSDNWGYALTPAVVNASTFGCQIIATTANNITASIDSITMKVDWMVKPMTRRRSR